MDKGIDAMTCDQFIAEIIRMLYEISNVGIYQFVKKILKIERLDG